MAALAILCPAAGSGIFQQQRSVHVSSPRPQPRPGRRAGTGGQRRNPPGQRPASSHPGRPAGNHGQGKQGPGAQRHRQLRAEVPAAAHYPEPRPADLPKDGGRYDLAIALGILAADGQVPIATLVDMECLGELALSGKLRPVQGVLPAALAAREAGRALVVPRENAEEASLAGGLVVYAVGHLLELVAHLNGQVPLPPYAANGLILQQRPYPDLSEVQGQLAAKRALLLAAAGAHNLLLLCNNTPTPSGPDR